MKIIKDVNIENYNAYDWEKNYTMRDDYIKVLQSWDYDKMKAFNKWLEEQTDEINEDAWDLEEYINDFEEKYDEEEEDEEN